MSCLVSLMQGADCDCGTDCYAAHKADLAVSEYWNLPPVRRVLLDAWIILLIGASRPNHAPWHGGVLHAQVDDENIGMGSGLTPVELAAPDSPISPLDRYLCHGWDLLTIPERALAIVIWENTMQGDDPRRPTRPKPGISDCPCGQPHPASITPEG